MQRSEFVPTSEQSEQLGALQRLAIDFNRRINLYSADSTRQFYDRHIRHSLILATRDFSGDSVVVDWGTGGGMPGLVLAIVFPGSTFHLVDAVEKKIYAVKTMARRLGLDNVQTHHTRAEAFTTPVTHSVSRATAPLATLWSWHERAAVPSDVDGKPREWPRGLICLKGGDLEAEIAELQSQHGALRVEQEELPDALASVGLEEKSAVLVTR